MEDVDSITRKMTIYVNKQFSGDWKKAFDTYAVNGKIDKDTLIRIFADAEVGYAISRSFFAGLALKTADLDKDGSVSWDEFQKLAHV